MTRLLKNKRGETLIETIVAVCVLLIILTGTAAIIASSINMVKATEAAYDEFRAETQQLEQENPASMPGGTEVEAKCVIRFSLKNNQQGSPAGPLVNYIVDATDYVVVTDSGLTYTK